LQRKRKAVFHNVFTEGSLHTIWHRTMENIWCSKPGGKVFCIYLLMFWISAIVNDFGASLQCCYMENIIKNAVISLASRINDQIRPGGDFSIGFDRCWLDFFKTRC
jgi:hypothetical protein